MQTLNKLLGALLISTFMLQLGLTLAPRALRNEVRCIGRLVRGLFFFLVVAPLTAWLVTKMFEPSTPSTVALVLLSCVGVAPLAVIPKLALLQGAPLVLGIFIRTRTARGASIEQVVRWINRVAFVAVFALVVAPHVGALAAPGWTGAAATVVLAILAAVGGYLVGGPGQAGGRTLPAIANVPNVGLALGIVTSVGARPIIAVTIVGVFLLRALIGAVVARLLARRAEHERRKPAYGVQPSIDGGAT